jgi:hypothetical protein
MTPIRRLHVLSGAMQSGGTVTMLAGCLLALSEDEARGAHIRWMQEQMPGCLVHSCNVFAIPDHLVLQAAELLK